MSEHGSVNGCYVQQLPFAEIIKENQSHFQEYSDTKWQYDFVVHNAIGNCSLGISLITLLFLIIIYRILIIMKKITTIQMMTFGNID